MYFVNFRIKAVAKRWRDVVMTVGNIKNKKVKIVCTGKKSKTILKKYKQVLSQKYFNTF